MPSHRRGFAAGRAQLAAADRRRIPVGASPGRCRVAGPLRTTFAGRSRSGASGRLPWSPPIGRAGFLSPGRCPVAGPLRTTFAGRMQRAGCPGRRRSAAPGSCRRGAALSPAHLEQPSPVGCSGPVALAAAGRARLVSVAASPARYNRLRQSAISFRYTFDAEPSPRVRRRSGAAGRRRFVAGFL